MLSDYLRHVQRIASSGGGVDELSYYPALSELFDSIGQRLDPKVRCVMNLRNMGAGLPDGGLFTEDQMSRRGTVSAATVPGRGAIEVKAARETLQAIIDSEQARRYTERYGQLLVTNLRQFALVVEDASGRRVVDEHSLADTEQQFWSLAASSRKPTAEHEASFEDFLVRVLLRGAPLREAADIAQLLAMFAREAKERMLSGNPPGLRDVRKALEGSLGITFTGVQGDQFFRSTLVQTLFYGIFSAWVLWAKERPRGPGERFNWHETAWHIHVPMARALFEQVATRSMLEPLRLVPILDAVADALNRVDRPRFFEAFDQRNAVLHFYEPFLRKFDPQLRKKMGVWFTPPEIVKYMVHRVDRILKEELGKADGFLDPDVYVLDPCVGTGSFLLAILRLMAARLGVPGDLSGAPMLKQITKTRIFGFELLPAPYVVAHLQIGLFLQNLGVPFNENEETDRAQVFLSNSLTGWNPEAGQQQHIPFPGFEEERDSANEVKRRSPILVVIGNPPYDGFSGVSPAEEEGLVESYKTGLRRWGFNKHKLDDPYIRFFRIAENKISQHEPFRGVVCYISNYSWVGHKTAVTVRESLLENFEKFWVDDLHGNRKISEYGPDGKTSETIFAMPGFSSGIQQGVVVSLWLKTSRDGGERVVRYRSDFDASRAADRRRQMLESLRESDPNSHYTIVPPDPERFLSFRPAVVIPEYAQWPELVALCEREPSLGLNENRKGALITQKRSEIEERMRAYFGNATNAQLTALGASGIVTNAPRFDAAAVRRRLRAGEQFSEEKVRRLIYRPFDMRWAYVTGGKLWNEARPELISDLAVTERFVIYRRNAQEPNDGAPLLITNCIGDQHVLHKDGYFIATRTRSGAGAHDGLFQQAVTANLSTAARGYLNSIGFSDQELEGEAGDHIWYHCLAIAFSPKYMLENADALAERIPRFPLPASRPHFDASVAIGRRIANLLDLDRAVPGVTSGTVPSNISSIAQLRRASDDQTPLQESDLEVTAGWGRRGGNGINPGRGKLVVHADDESLEVEDDERVDFEKAVVDAYLNDGVFWSNIPGSVWNFHIAGYQVLKKWLSYREGSILGRPLTIEEAREFAAIARRLAAIVNAGDELDENYLTCKANFVAF